jgi:hypothetical protein
MAEAIPKKRKRPAPWKGRRKAADPKSKSFPIRFTPQQFEQLDATAREAGMSVGAFARAVLMGSPGPRAVRKPPVQKAELARLLGELGKVGSNVNQIARAFNQHQDSPSLRELTEIKGELVAMRVAIMKALGREP